LGAVRIDDFKYQFLQQPWGWPGEKLATDMPTITNLRWDPFERLSPLRGESINNSSPAYLNDFMAREFWRFVSVQQAVGKLAMTAIDYPPMQAPASFNLSALKAKIDDMIKSHESQ
jgi:arylsulfatase